MSGATRRARYQQIADELRAKIADGTYPLDTPLPSTGQLMETYDVSMTVARAAVKELQVEGLVEGHPGKGVYVLREPAPVEPSPEYVQLTREIDSVRKVMEETLSELDKRVSELEQSARREDDQEGR